MALDCPHCQTTIPPGRDTCPGCGRPATDVEEMPTRVAPSPTHTSRSVWSSSDGTVVPGQVLGGRFAILGPLGGGGMGEVFEAQDLELGVVVALKFLRPEVVTDPTGAQRFRGEVRLSRSIADPNVCRTFDLGEIEGKRFISMEYVPGADLRTVLRWAGGVRKDKLLHIAREICAGLEAVHQAGILHGDLKPANVLLDRNGHVRLTDFGLARFSRGAGGHGAGTPAYMAPEEFEPGEAADERADIYSLGVLLYEMATGRLPLQAEGFSGWARAHREEAPVPPRRLEPALDPGLQEVILRCLGKRPGDRFDDVRALDATLEAVEKGLPLAGLLPERTWLASVSRGRMAVRVAAAAILLAAGTLLLLVPGPGRSLLSRIPFRLSPDAATERARAVIRDLGGAGEERLAHRHVEENREALRAAAAHPGTIRLLETGDPPVLAYQLTFEGSDEADRTHEWPFGGDPFSPGAGGSRPAALEHPGDARLDLTGTGALTRLAWWPASLAPQPGVRDRVSRLAGVDLSGYELQGDPEARPCPAGVVVEEVYRRRDPPLAERESLRLSYWRPEALSPEETDPSGLLLELERHLDFGQPELVGDLRALKQTRPYIALLVGLGALATGLVIWVLVLAARRRAVSVGRAVTVGVTGGILYLAPVALAGTVSEGLGFFPTTMALLTGVLGGLVMGLPLGALFAAGEAAVSAWWPGKVTSWQKLLYRGPRDPQVAADGVHGAGLAGLGLLLGFAWEVIRHALDLPPMLPQPRMAALGTQPLVVPLLILSHLSVSFFLAFGLTGLLSLFRHLLRRPAAADLLGFCLILVCATAVVGSLWDLVAFAIYLGVALLALHLWGVLALLATVWFVSLTGTLPMGFPTDSPFATSTTVLLVTATLLFAGAAVTSFLGAGRRRAQPDAA